MPCVGSEFVVVIDDDEDTRENLTDILALDSYKVDAAASFAEAVERINWPQAFCILLDRKLPDGDAIKLLPRLKRLAPDAAVIIVTGYADLAGAVDALREGAADYLIKPINPDALRASVARITQQKQAAAEIERLSLEHAHAAEALMESERRLRAIFENAMDGILIADDDGRYIDANPAACTKLGYSRDEITNLNVADLVCFPPDKTFAETWHYFLKNGQLSGECAMRCKDGTIIEVEFRSAASFLPGMNLSSIRDVTNRKRAEQRALQSERLAAIGETMAGLVHEGRNALQRSKACLEMLAVEVEDRPEALDLVNRVLRAQEHLHHLYEEVRQYAAPIKLKNERCALREVWREAWQNVAQLNNGKQIRLQEHLLADVACEGDHFALGQVFRNIFENAIQASPDGSCIRVSCNRSCHEGRPMLACSVRDEGPGMDAETRRQVFDPFFTTKTKGTGLGMAICQRIVHAHGGTIEIADRDGPGAEIIIYLPEASS